MQRSLSLEEFAKLAGLDPDEVESYRKAGVLDVDGDRLFDEFDALRLRYLLIALDRGLTLDEFARSIRERQLPADGFVQLLWPTGADQWFSPEEVAERLGFSLEQLQTIRAATGLPGMALSEEDVKTFEGVKLMMDGGFSYEAILEGARVLGDSMRRFAETEMRLTHKYLHEPLLGEGTSEREVARQTQDVIESAVLPVIDPLMLAIHRQHLLRFVIEDALLHLEAAERSGPPGTIEAAMVFIDLTSFTSLTSVMGDEAAADVIDRFDRLVRPMVLDHGGTLVKQIGDAFMLAFGKAADAVVFSVAFANAALREENFPAIRIGINFGPVLFRVGDYVGNTVNIASRLSTSAAAGEIVMTEPVARAAERAEVPVEEVGVRLLRGVSDPLNLYRVIRPRESAPSRDPVCGMYVTSRNWRLAWEGRDFSFCSEKCLRKFLDDPGSYSV